MRRNLLAAGVGIALFALVAWWAADVWWKTGGFPL